MQNNRNKLEELAQEYVKEGKQALFDRKLDKAALSIQAAINLFKETGNVADYIRSVNLIGVIYAAIGNETMAVDFYLEGLECAILNGLHGMTLPFYNNIGSRYMELNEYDKAIAYFKRGEEVLAYPEVKSEERYDAWYMVTCINLMSSYTSLGEYDKATAYLKKARPHIGENQMREYGLSFMVAEYKLYWAMGNKEKVYEYLDEFLEYVLNDESASDYVRNMYSVSCMLGEMGEYEKWKSVIETFERYAKEQASVYVQLVLTEMWLDYYKATEDMQKYIQLCVEHVDLYHKHKVIEDKERAAAIDLKIQLQDKESERRMAEKMSFTDSLTGLGNRYKLFVDSCTIQNACIERKTRMAIGILDVDCFKEHNDTYGHLRGDDTLQSMAEVLKTVIDGVGMAYRFGGDEFVILLQDTTVEKIVQIAEKIKKGIKELRIANVNSKIIPEITISQGYYVFVPQFEQKVEDILENADKALYYVKEHGRNHYHIIEETEDI